MILPNRGVLALSGEGRVDFLQGLVTNHVGAAPAYACLLTAQGRFLHDFFVIPDGDRLLIDCEANRRADLIARLKRFRLRAKVEIDDVSDDGAVFILPANSQGTMSSTTIRFADPRHADLGYRMYVALDGSDGVWDDFSYDEWDRARIMLGVPDGSRDMVPEEALLLENNIDRLNGIDWNKGCYVGQEVTARMHYKGGAKKRLTPVRIDGPPPVPGTIVMAGDSQVGEMRSSCRDVGLAFVSIGKIDQFRCGPAVLKPLALIA